MYIAEDQEAVWNDEGSLYAFKPDPGFPDQYEALDPNVAISGIFIPVPVGVAKGIEDLNGNPVGPGMEQDVLEDWSDANGVFEFLRIEDVAYDRNTPNVVYMADTGGSSAFPNGRMFKIVLHPADPTVVTELSVLIDGDAFPAGDLAAIHQPDNIETTKWSLMIQEDPGSRHDYPAGDPNGTTAWIWRYDLQTGELMVVAKVDQSLDPDADWGDWESGGIVDASTYFGRDAFLVDVQAHTLYIETNEIPNPLWPAEGASETITQKRKRTATAAPGDRCPRKKERLLEGSASLAPPKFATISYFERHLPTARPGSGHLGNRQAPKEQNDGLCGGFVVAQTTKTCVYDVFQIFRWRLTE